jgi:transcription elongation factor Elf1
MDIQKLKNKYLKKSHCCIICDSDNIEGGSVDVDAGGATQEITCNNCGAYWHDLYVLDDVVNLHLGGEDDG